LRVSLLSQIPLVVWSLTLCFFFPSFYRPEHDQLLHWIPSRGLDHPLLFRQR
jgi:hypothetical protein